VRVARLFVSALAVVLIAWFVLVAREAHELDQASAIAQRATVSAAAERDANQLLDSASVLNPDREINLTRGALAIDRGRFARARSILLAATRAEPENIVAWDLLAHNSGNPLRLEGEAVAHIDRLQPPLKTPH
jgi:predicted Zn-dependent protease